MPKLNVVESRAARRVNMDRYISRARLEGPKTRKIYFDFHHAVENELDKRSYTKKKVDIMYLFSSRLGIFLSEEKTTLS